MHELYEYWMDDLETMHMDAEDEIMKWMDGMNGCGWIDGSEWTEVSHGFAGMD